MTRSDDEWIISDIIKICIAFTLWCLSCLQLYVSYSSLQKRIMYISLVIVGPILILLYANAHNVIMDSRVWQVHTVLQSLTLAVLGSLAFHVMKMLSLAVSTAVQRLSRRQIDTEKICLWIHIMFAVYNCFLLAGTIAMLATNRQAFSAIRFSGVVIVGIGCGSNICLFVLKLKRVLKRMENKSETKFSRSFSETNPHVFSGDRLQRLQRRLTNIFFIYLFSSLIAVAGGVRISYSSSSENQSLRDSIKTETENYSVIADVEYYIFLLLTFGYLYYGWTPIYSYIFPNAFRSSDGVARKSSKSSRSRSPSRSQDKTRRKGSEDLFNISSRPVRTIRVARASTGNMVSVPKVISFGSQMESPLEENIKNNTSNAKGKLQESNKEQRYEMKK
mmetsp:Transcript_3470/g.5188  ORF Transcript_3470/g.5188 Transcript_3470/m.5188 type:complete len:390 (-) Transcript_3470:27-1196(-)